MHTCILWHYFCFMFTTGLQKVKLFEHSLFTPQFTGGSFNNGWYLPDWFDALARRLPALKRIDLDYEKFFNKHLFNPGPLLTINHSRLTELTDLFIRMPVDHQPDIATFRRQIELEHTFPRLVRLELQIPSDYCLVCGHYYHFFTAPEKEQQRRGCIQHQAVTFRTCPALRQIQFYFQSYGGRSKDGRQVILRKHTQIIWRPFELENVDSLVSSVSTRLVAEQYW